MSILQILIFIERNTHSDYVAELHNYVVTEYNLMKSTKLEPSTHLEIVLLYWKQISVLKIFNHKANPDALNYRR